MLTKSERSARNKAAHAIRRAMADADYRQAKQEGRPITWREIATTYDAIPADIVLTMGLPATDTDPRPAKSRRDAPPHVARARDAHALAMESWSAGLADALRGARRNGKPARGERWTDEERDYRAKNPCPTFREFLDAECAALRAEREAVPA